MKKHLKEIEEIMTHIAIMPDGNRRWARERNSPGFVGHREGLDTMEKIIKNAFDSGINYLTIWGASVSNITERSKKEVEFLFSVFKEGFDKLAKSKELQETGVRVRIIGEWRDYFPENLIKACENLITITRKNNGPSLTFMLAYSGMGEMIEAVKKLAERRAREPDFEITREALKASLMTADLPPVDFVIRTGGEPHWSDGFMMWDTANAQLYFTDTLWPAFTAEEFKLAIDRFKRTERRTGK